MNKPQPSATRPIARMGAPVAKPKPALRRWAPALALVALIALGATVLAVRANRGPVRVSGFSRDAAALLSSPSVQKELRLTADQLAKVSELEQHRQSLSTDLQNLSSKERDRKWADEMAKTDTELASILESGQLSRLRQVYWQWRGLRALDDEEIIKTLKLTPEQKKQIDTVQDEIRRDTRDVIQTAPIPEIRKKVDALRKSGDDRVMDVLTPEQQVKWKEIIGEPFKGELPQRGFGGGGFGGGGPGGRGRTRGPTL